MVKSLIKAVVTSCLITLTTTISGPVQSSGFDSMTVGESMNRCLSSYNWSNWNIWRFDIYAVAQEKVIIGNSENHFRFSSEHPGYEHIVNGKVFSKNTEIEKISQLNAHCSSNCPNNIVKRLSWFKRKCKAFE